MKGSWWRPVLPALVMLLFALFLTSDWLTKQPTGSEDDVQLWLQTVQRDVLSADWEAADSDWRRLQAAWQRVTRRVQFTVERDEIRGLSLSLARLQGAILAEDQAAALSELGEAAEHWRDLGR